MQKYLLAQLTSVTAGLLAYPFDTVRKRIQMDAGRANKNYSGAFDCFGKILAQEGVAGFYRAFYIPILAGQAGSCLLIAYDKLKEN